MTGNLPREKLPALKKKAEKKQNGQNSDELGATTPSDRDLPPSGLVVC